MSENTHVAPDTTPTDATSGIQVSSASTIRDFAPEVWNGLIPRDEPQLRHDFLQAVEASGMLKEPLYIAVKDQNDALLGVGVASLLDIDVLILASPKLHKIARSIRRGPLKRFLVLRAVSCGPVVTNCRSNLFLKPGLAPHQSRQVARLLVQSIDRINGGALRVFFEHPQSTVEQFGGALKNCGYIQAASLPGTELPILWNTFGEYTAAMRKLYRRAVNDDLKVGEQLDIRVESNFAALSNEVHTLYMNVIERASNVLDILTPEFFEAIGKCEQARLVTAREKSTGKLVGIELLLVGDTLIQDLYTGVDYGANEEYRTYFNLIYPGIALACDQGMKTLSTGQTSYVFKSRLGVEPFPLSIFMKHRNPVIHWFLQTFKDVLCPIIQAPTHRVFREDVNGRGGEITPAPASPVETPPVLPTETPTLHPSPAL